MLENDTSATAVGKRLRYVRKLADLSREGLAKQAGISPTSISYWEHADDESSKMTFRSMSKVLDALNKNGVECSEQWLRSGTGPAPRYVDVAHSDQPISTEKDALDTTALSAQLITHMGEEIKRFTSISGLAVITKVDTNCMHPALKRGDIVGGIWQSGSTLEAENICIIETGSKLQVRRVIPTNKNGLFHITFLTYDISSTEPFEVKEVILEKVAPIIRVWR